MPVWLFAYRSAIVPVSANQLDSPGLTKMALATSGF